VESLPQALLQTYALASGDAEANDLLLVSVAIGVFSIAFTRYQVR
jgi:hypothetical protein